MSIIDGKMFHMNAELLTANELDPSPLRDTELVQEIQFLTARLAAKGNNHANKLLEELDLNVRQFSVLALAASELKPTQREMSAFVALDPSQIVALVDTLEDRGLVKRETDRRDRRSKNIVATEDGEKLYRRARTITITAEDHVLSKLTETERDQLRELLTKATL
ncbi:MarR family winged helix-turn-helix transcriptional regulator [Yaniella halotolerans]|uniref:MarR family winged helix-turn-helix transcriptional regulator n=1 Tax=Yaniella halotolerans TaxID=225453 RepID=UPI001FE1CE33|nr:MarR family transcriptional regulator [Yaniella halotolerans]